MSFRMLNLIQMEVMSSGEQDGHFNLAFKDAHIVKTMDNAQQRTRWRQSGQLWIREVAMAEYPEHAPPYRIAHGDLIDNNYVYRDSVRLPLHSHGHVGIEWVMADSEQRLLVFGTEIEVVLAGTAHYVEHLNESNEENTKQ